MDEASSGRPSNSGKLQRLMVAPGGVVYERLLDCVTNTWVTMARARHGGYSCDGLGDRQ